MHETDDIFIVQMSEMNINLIDELRDSINFDLKAKPPQIDLSRLSAGGSPNATADPRKSANFLQQPNTEPAPSNNEEEKSSSKEAPASSTNDVATPPESNVGECRSENIENEINSNKQEPFQRKKQHPHKSTKPCKPTSIDTTNSPESMPIPKSCNQNVTYSLQKSGEKDLTPDEQPEMQKGKCNHIRSLKNQIYKIKDDVDYIREEDLPRKCVERYNYLTNQLRELTSFLSDLRHSCMRQKFENNSEENDVEENIELIQNLQTSLIRPSVSTQGTTTEEFHPCTCKREQSKWNTEVERPQCPHNKSRPRNCIGQNAWKSPDTSNIEPKGDHNVDLDSNYKQSKRESQESESFKFRSFSTHDAQNTYPNSDQVDVMNGYKGTKCKQLERKCQKEESLESELKKEKCNQQDIKGNQKTKLRVQIDSKPLIYDDITDSSTEDFFKYAHAQRRCHGLKKKQQRNEEDNINYGDDNLTTANRIIIESRCPYNCTGYKNNEYMLNSDGTGYFNGYEMDVHIKVPLIRSNLSEAIDNIVKDIKPSSLIVLTLLLQLDNLYHVNVSLLHPKQALGCLFTTEKCIAQAYREHLFDNYLTFFVVSSNNTKKQQHKILCRSLDSME